MKTNVIAECCILYDSVVKSAQMYLNARCVYFRFLSHIACWSKQFVQLHLAASGFSCAVIN